MTEELLQTLDGQLEEKKEGFPGGSVAKTLSSRCRGPRFSPWSENSIPCAAARSSHASSKGPACSN